MPLSTEGKKEGAEVGREGVDSYLIQRLETILQHGLHALVQCGGVEG